MTSPPKPCVSNSSTKFNIRSFDDARKSFSHAKELVDLKHCDHVGIVEIASENYGAGAVCFVNCFEPRTKPVSCGPAKNELMVFLLRPGRNADRRMNAVQTGIIITSGPAETIELSGGEVENDKSVLKLGQKILYPRTNQIPEEEDDDYYWKKTIDLNVRPSYEFVRGVINVRLDIEYGPPTERPIQLKVGVPPRTDAPRSKPMVDAAVIVSIEGSQVKSLGAIIDVLLRSSESQGKLLLFKVGGKEIPLSSGKSNLELLDGALSARAFANQIHVLDGYQTKLDNLLVRKGFLLASQDKYGAHVAVDIGEKLAFVEQDIKTTEKDILRLLDSIREVSILTAQRRTLTDSEIAEFGVDAMRERESLQLWAGSNWATLAIVFTDIVNYTKHGLALGDAPMSVVRNAHFRRSRDLIDQHVGKEVKTIGDSFMIVFKSVGPALDYAIALSHQTGHPDLRVRAAIHVGPLEVEKEDVFGTHVNFAARVLGKIEGPEIWISNEAKTDLYTVRDHEYLKWDEHIGVELKSFQEKTTLWSLNPAG